MAPIVKLWKREYLKRAKCEDVFPCPKSLLYVYRCPTDSLPVNTNMIPSIHSTVHGVCCPCSLALLPVCCTCAFITVRVN